MGYLDNTSITVDAILTKKGRQKLASGQSLNITKFALGDDEIDYTLYEPAHPRVVLIMIRQLRRFQLWKLVLTKRKY